MYYFSWLVYLILSIVDDSPSVTIPELFNEHQNLICNLFLSLAFRIEDEVVVAGLVAGSGSKPLYVILTHPIHLLDNLAGFVFRDILFGGDTCHTVGHRCLNEDA